MRSSSRSSFVSTIPRTSPFRSGYAQNGRIPDAEAERWCLSDQNVRARNPAIGPVARRSAAPARGATPKDLRGRGFQPRTAGTIDLRLRSRERSRILAAPGHFPLLLEPPPRPIHPTPPQAERFFSPALVPRGLEDAVGTPEGLEIRQRRPRADRETGRLARAERGRLENGGSQNGYAEHVGLQLHQ